MKKLLILGIGVVIGIAGFVGYFAGAHSKCVVNRVDLCAPLKRQDADRKGESAAPLEDGLRGGFVSLEEAEGGLSTLPIDYTTEHFTVQGQDWFAVSSPL